MEYINDNWRSVVVDEIRRARRYDKEYGYELYRDLSGYIYELMGVMHFLEYLSSNSSKLRSRRVLDIGAGSCMATSQIRSSLRGRDLTVEATVLRLCRGVEVNFGLKGLHVTSCEVLREIPDLSIAGIISVFGVAYSKVPIQAIFQINRVLVPSGVFKSVFYSERARIYDGLTPNVPDDFESALKNHGYDVAVEKHERVGSKVLVAVKPPILIPASELLSLDISDWRSQQNEAIKLFPPR